MTARAWQRVVDLWHRRSARDFAEEATARSGGQRGILYVEVRGDDIVRMFWKSGGEIGAEYTPAMPDRWLMGVLLLMDPTKEVLVALRECRVNDRMKCHTAYWRMPVRRPTIH